MNGKFHRGVRRFCSIIIGAVFLLSAMLKLMDPVGTGLIVKEYLNFFHLGFLGGLSNFFGSSIAFIEAAVAVLMMFGVFRRFTALFSGAVIIAFTILTLILLIFNPEMECGCFGEAIPLTHLQTFIKNIVLVILWVITVFPLGSAGAPKKSKYVGFAVVCAGIIGFAIYSLSNIPLVDFTDFAPGTELVAAQDEEFQEEGENLPEKIVNVLSISDISGDYQDWIAANGDVLIASVYKPEKMDEKDWDDVRSVLQEAQMSGMSPIILCASHESVPVEVSDLVFFSDYKTLITLNRSNGGFTYFSDGRVITKWSLKQRPGAKEFGEILERNPLDVMMTTDTENRLSFQIYFLISFLIMLFV